MAKGGIQVLLFASCCRTSTSWEVISIVGIFAAVDATRGKAEASRRAMASHCAPTSYGIKAMSKTQWLTVGFPRHWLGYDVIITNDA